MEGIPKETACDIKRGKETHCLAIVLNTFYFISLSHGNNCVNSNIIDWVSKEADSEIKFRGKTLIKKSLGSGHIERRKMMSGQRENLSFYIDATTASIGSISREMIVPSRAKMGRPQRPIFISHWLWTETRYDLEKTTSLKCI